MASAAIGLQQRLAQFQQQQQQQMARQQQHKQQAGQQPHPPLPSVTLPQPGTQPFPPYMYRPQQEAQPSTPSTSQPPPSQGMSAAGPPYSSGQPGQPGLPGAGSPRVPKAGQVSWGDAQAGAQGLPGGNPVSAGALQQVQTPALSCSAECSPAL